MTQPIITAARLVASTGFKSGLADKFNIGTRAKLSNALKALEKAPVDEKKVQEFSLAFSKRTSDLTNKKGLFGKETQTLLVALLQRGGIADSKQRGIALQVARDKVATEAGRLKKVDSSKLPSAIKEKAIALADIIPNVPRGRLARFTGFGSIKNRLAVSAAKADFKKAIREAVSEKRSPKVQLDIVGLKASSEKDKVDEQVAINLAARATALDISKVELAQAEADVLSQELKSGKNANKAQKLVDAQNEKIAKQLEEKGLPALANLKTRLAILIAAGKKTKGVDVASLETASKTISSFLKKETKSAAEFVKVSKTVTESIEKALGKEGIFKAADAKKGFFTSKTAQAERDAALESVKSLSKEAKGSEKAQTVLKKDKALLTQASTDLQAARDAVATLEKTVKVESKFFAQKRKAQEADTGGKVVKEQEALLKKAVALQSFLNPASTRDVAKAYAKTAAKVALATAIIAGTGYAVYNFFPGASDQADRVAGLAVNATKSAANVAQEKAGVALEVAQDKLGVAFNATKANLADASTFTKGAFANATAFAGSFFSGNAIPADAYKIDSLKNAYGIK